mgnify:CR=1 FL=1
MNIDITFERRKYGKTTFTWVKMWNKDHWITLGDPWPVKNPPKKEVLASVADAILRFGITKPGLCLGGDAVKMVWIPED